jgi:hypothetical protein
MSEDLVPGAKTTPRVASAWISPAGAFHWVPVAGHTFTALTLGDEEAGDGLERAGWVHFSFSGAHHRYPLTQGQLDTLFDILSQCEANPRAYLCSDYKRGAQRAIEQAN